MRWLAVLVGVAVLSSSAVPQAGLAQAYDAAKIDPGFLREVLAQPDGEFPVIVRAAPRNDAKDQAERAGKHILRAAGKAKLPLPIVGGAAGTAKGAHVLKLTLEPDVDYVFRDAPLRVSFDPADAGKVTSVGILAIGAPSAWSQYGVTGRGVTVAVLDSGISGHPDLAGRIVAAIDFTSATPAVCLCVLGDPGGHGTHVAGLIAGDGASSGGAYTGVAPNAKLVDVRVIDASGSSSTSVVLRGLQWVLSNRVTYGVRAVNLSLGAKASGSYTTDPLATAVELLTFAGVTVVAAAGNLGPDPQTITTPGTDPYVLTVGAADDAGTVTAADDAIASWSSRGPTAFDNLQKPGIVAPGRRLVSLRSPGSALDLLYPDRQVAASGELVPSYFRMSGTSMATALATGAVALMLERDPQATPRVVKKRLLKTAVRLASGSSNDQGQGLLNALEAVASSDPSASYSQRRVTDAFAKDMRRHVEGQSIVWRDLWFNGGVDARGIPWANISWENISWENITWENLSWEAFNWSNISWENVSWENITWESADPVPLGVAGGAGGWALVD